MPVPQTLAALEADVARDLALTAHPRAPWLLPKTCAGAPVLDALVIGGGQCGLAVAFALMRDRVDRLLVIDRAAEGQEGPWSSYARMHALRSLKDQTGPDLKLASLTYQAWHEAQWGEADFAAMRFIPRGHWHAYLHWFRRVAGVPVRNGVLAGRIGPARTDDGLPCLRVETDQGPILARKVVMATGQEGIGGWWMPPAVAALPAAFRAHTADAIDFAALAGRRVAVLGAGASAFDNAAVALEAGAASVDLLCRRAEPVVVQPYRWLTFAGFLRHLHEMEDAWRWRFMAMILACARGSRRIIMTACGCMRISACLRAMASPVRGSRARPVVLETPSGDVGADFVICGTGAAMDPALVPALEGCASNIALWQDRYVPPADEADARLGMFPYLGPDSAFQEKRRGETPWIRDIHLFGIGTTMSFGPAGSSINAMSIAAPRCAAGVTRGLFEADLPRLWSELRAYAVPQVVLAP